MSGTGQPSLDAPPGAAEELVLVEPGDPNAVARWTPEDGWQVAAGWPAAAGALFDLYWPLLSLPARRAYAIGHLGQSLDGCIATRPGQSHALNGSANLVHLHRMRALCDAVLVGASTALADDPQLTTRRVSGANPLRIILDPTARLANSLRVFSDQQAPTMLVCGTDYQRLAVSRFGRARVIAVPLVKKRFDVAALLKQLAEIGAPVVFVEGGGVTVTRFIEADCLDRLQIAVAPVFLGAGREGLQLAGAAQIASALRPAHRVYRMGCDFLWDFDMRDRQAAGQADPQHDALQFERII